MSPPPGGTRALSFIQTEEGRVRKNGTTYTYEYDLKDHLGNTRVTIMPDPLNGGQAKIIQESSYYAFGMEMPGNEVNYFSGTKNKYLYNGKELQDEPNFNLYDYGARFYDPTIGRWNAVDPLAETMVSVSPYNYAFNNPLRFTDPLGLAPNDNVGADGLTNDQWLSSSRVGASQGLANEYQRQNQDDKKKREDKNTEEVSTEPGAFSLTKEEQLRMGLRYYGGDYSGSMSDNLLLAMDAMNTINPIAIAWDVYSGITGGTDRMGNSQSAF